MEIIRKLRKVGDSVMVPLPPEILQEAGLAVDSQVVIRSRAGHIVIEPEGGPDLDALEFLDSLREQVAVTVAVNPPPLGAERRARKISWLAQGYCTLGFVEFKVHTRTRRSPTEPPKLTATVTATPVDRGGFRP